MLKNCEQCGHLYPAFPTKNTRHCSAECRHQASLLAVGSVWGRWTVLEQCGTNRRGKQLVKVRCKCGTIRTIRTSGLKNGRSKSCGCLRTDVVATGNNRRTHGMTGTPEWKTFHSAKKRCTNPNDTRFVSYGGRGIEFRFTSFEEFYQELGPKPTPHHSINRINNDGHYEPGNVEWATDEEQRKNKRRNGPIPKSRPP